MIVNEKARQISSQNGNFGIGWGIKYRSLLLLLLRLVVIIRIRRISSSRRADFVRAMEGGVIAGAYQRYML